MPDVSYQPSECLDILKREIIDRARQAFGLHSSLFV